MAAGGILPLYQQPKFVSSVAGYPLSRRTLRIREKYVLGLVGFVFSFVCFGAIFFLPDMRDRVSSEGYIGPAEDLFIPRPDNTVHAFRPGRDRKPADALPDRMRQSSPAHERVRTRETDSISDHRTHSRGIVTGIHRHNATLNQSASYVDDERREKIKAVGYCNDCKCTLLTSVMA